MKATNNVGSIGTRWSSVHGNATQHISFMTLWSMRSKFNKLLKGVRDSPCEIEKLNTFFDDCLNKQHQGHNIEAEVNSVNSTIPVVTQNEQDIIASDPINPAPVYFASRFTSRAGLWLDATKIPKMRCYCDYDATEVATVTLFRSTTSQLIAYSDADWAGCQATCRSTSRYCVFLGDNLLTWSSKRQDTLSRSSAEAEHRGVANTVVETS
ncbi:ribonuclease H-like domain-containing protein [Tanacetum coccineum]